MIAIPRLHVIVNATSADVGVELTKCVLDAGAPLVQVRVKGVTDIERLRLTAPLVELCHEFGALAIVNDRADICLATGADGVHGGADDLPADALRDLVGPDKIVGGTARNPADARALEAAGVDYLGVGPVYATATKIGLPDPLGPAVIEQTSATVEVPVLAIAGVTVDHVPELVRSGAHGVAVVSAISAASDPAAAVRAFVSALDRAVAEEVGS